MAICQTQSGETAVTSSWRLPPVAIRVVLLSVQSPPSVAVSGPAAPPGRTSVTVITGLVPPSPDDPTGQLSAMPSPQLPPVMNRAVPVGRVAPPPPQKSRPGTVLCPLPGPPGTPRLC